MMDAEFLELRIPITENTTKKIVALAALTGKSLADIKEAIASDLIDEEAFDAFVSQQLHGALAVLDGAGEEEESLSEMRYATAPTSRRQSSFARAEQEANSVIDDIAGHSVSQDEDTGAQSLEDAYAAEEKALRERPVLRQQPVDELEIPQMEFPDVGENVDAFIDIGSDDQPVQASLAAKVAKTKSTSTRRSKKGATISEYTGDEDAELF